MGKATVKNVLIAGCVPVVKVALNCGAAALDVVLINTNLTLEAGSCFNIDLT